MDRPERTVHRGLARPLPRALACTPQHRPEWGLGDLADTIGWLSPSSLPTRSKPRLTTMGDLATPGYSPGVHPPPALHRWGSSAVEVWDENFQLPVPAPASLDDESGRGLMLVDALAERWGWNMPPSGRGKIVWALVGR